MPYYTRSGDKGYTGICDEKRISKSSLRVIAFGEIDELNSWIGLCRAVCKDKEIDKILGRIQSELFVLGADLAAPLKSKFKVKRISEGQEKWMEEAIDKIAEEVGELKKFILPGGSELASRLYVARAVCRRAERAIVALSEKEEINRADLAFINRLSSLLFVLARLANKREGIEDIHWD